MARVGYDLGIDLGTTYTAAAVSRRKGHTEVVQLGVQRAEIPTVVFLADDGEFLIGEPANRRGHTEPTRLAREFKRRLGDAAPVLLGGTPISAEELSAQVLRWVVAHVTAHEGSPPRRVVLTHPANWGPYKREVFEQAARLADLGAELLTEPAAAAAHFAHDGRIAIGDVVVVYDLGGGTFDTAVLERITGGSDGRIKGGFELRGAPEGIERLGGADIDDAIFSFVDGQLDGAVTAQDPDDSGAATGMLRLREECRSAKEALSSDSRVTIPVHLPGLHTEVGLTRSELEALVRPTLARTVGAVGRALGSAGVTAEDLAATVLVGGQSRMPLVQELVAGALRRPVKIDPNPKYAVALGAALHAATLSSPRTGPVPVVPMTALPARANEAAAAVPGLVSKATVKKPAPTKAAAKKAAPATPPPAPETDRSGRPSVAPGRNRRRQLRISIAAVVALIVGGIVANLDGGGDDELATTESTTSTTAARSLPVGETTTTTLATADVSTGEPITTGGTTPSDPGVLIGVDDDGDETIAEAPISCPDRCLDSASFDLDHDGGADRVFYSAAGRSDGEFDLNVTVQFGGGGIATTNLGHLSENALPAMRIVGASNLDRQGADELVFSTIAFDSYATLEMVHVVDHQSIVHSFLVGTTNVYGPVIDSSSDFVRGMTCNSDGSLTLSNLQSVEGGWRGDATRYAPTGDGNFTVGATTPLGPFPQDPSGPDLQPPEVTALAGLHCEGLPQFPT